MIKINLIHFNKDEIVTRTTQLQSLGFVVDSQLPAGGDFFKVMKEEPPDVVIIDLSQSPSQGRDVGVYLRHTKATRFIPLVFVDGKADKVEKAKEQLPDATYTSWDRIEKDLRNAMIAPVKNPVVPSSNLAGYSGTPLPKKLGIKEGMIVGLMHAPKDFLSVLGELPPDVSICYDDVKNCSLILWFLRSQQELLAEINKMTITAEMARIWMVWPKKTSTLACDLTQQIVRECGLAAGLVDYKVCAVDETWSGLLFTKNKK